MHHREMTITPLYKNASSTHVSFWTQFYSESNILKSFFTKWTPLSARFVGIGIEKNSLLLKLRTSQITSPQMYVEIGS